MKPNQRLSPHKIGLEEFARPGDISKTDLSRNVVLTIKRDLSLAQRAGSFEEDSQSEGFSKQGPAPITTQREQQARLKQWTRLPSADDASEWGFLKN
jgi:hypothetical protein